MNIETPANTQNRKRTRQRDLNQSVPYVLPKLRKTEARRDKMSNPGQNQQAQFIDLSRTINSGKPAPAVNTSASAADTGEEITPEVIQLVTSEVNVVQRSLEDKVKEMVQLEMTGIRKSIEQLTQYVSDLARTTAQGHSAIIMNQPVNHTRVPCSDTTSQTDERSTAQINSQGGGILLPAQNILPIQSVELNRIRVDKLGIVFDGNPAHITIDDFIFRLEHLQRHYQIPWNEVLRDFHLLLNGPAREWYWLYIRTNGVVDWTGLKHALLAHYQTNRSNFEILRDLVERKQQSGESVDSFFHVMCQIRSRLIQPIPEYDLIKIIKRNVKESIGRIVYPIPVSSVEQLRVECNEAERNFPRRDFRQIPPTTKAKYVNEIHYNEEEHVQELSQAERSEEICALNSNPPQRKQPIVCWNCRQQGHLFMDCTSVERTLFCYKCGRQNVITPKCPNCQSGNQQRSSVSRGEPSSTTSQTPKMN